MFEYGASVIRVVDGDTIWLRVDLGFRIFTENDFRLVGIDSPERGQPGYMEAKNHLADLVSELGPITIRTQKPDSFGRWLATLIGKDGTNINEKMVADGHAVFASR